MTIDRSHIHSTRSQYIILIMPVFFRNIHFPTYDGLGTSLSTERIAIAITGFVYSLYTVLLIRVHNSAKYIVHYVLLIIETCSLEPHTERTDIVVVQVRHRHVDEYIVHIYSKLRHYLPPSILRCAHNISHNTSRCLVYCCDSVCFSRCCVVKVLQQNMEQSYI